VRWRAPKSTVVVDRQAAANPEQARKLLSAVKDTKRSGADRGCRPSSL
jgi:hypothetical protein